jgi:glycosyltransferase involved in cell wall biosynthesis
MASGVPCVVTDVGDSREIVREGGLCVVPEDPGALARSLILLIEAGAQIRRAVGAEGRRRIEEQYGIQRIVARYTDIYRSEARQPATLPAGSRKEVASCVG